MVEGSLSITHCFRLNLQLHTIDCSELVIKVVSVLLCGNWQDFNWHDASRGPSAIAELLVSTGGVPAMKPEATAIRFADPDFRLSAKFQQFGDVLRCFLHFTCWLSAIFLPPVCFTYWPKKYTTRVDHHVDNSHQVWSWYDHQLPSYSVFVYRYVTSPCDLDLWPFGLEQLSFMASHVTNLATEYEDPTPIRSWVTSYYGSHWLPLKMRTRPMRIRGITWPVSRGWKRLHFWNPRPRFAYSLYNFGGSTMNIIKVICENNAPPCVKTYEFMRMREITWSVKGGLNVLLQSFSSTSIYSIEL